MAERTVLIPVAELRRHPGTVDERRFVTDVDGARVVGTELVDGSEADVHLRLEALSDGIVVTGSVDGAWVGECRRCLEPVSGRMTGTIDELARTHPTDDELAIEDDRIDLTDAIRESLVLALPLAPLCDEECVGPDSRYPVTVVVDPEDVPEDERPPDPRWAALEGLDPEHTSRDRPRSG